MQGYGFFDDFSVSVDIPDNTPLGTYYLYYHNGMGGKTAWSEPLRIDVVSKSPDWWGVKVFNVMDYGAVGDGVHNEPQLSVQLFMLPDKMVAVRYMCREADICLQVSSFFLQTH